MNAEKDTMRIVVQAGWRSAEKHREAQISEGLLRAIAFGRHTFDRSEPGNRENFIEGNCPEFVLQLGLGEVEVLSALWDIDVDEVFIQYLVRLAYIGLNCSSAEKNEGQNKNALIHLYFSRCKISYSIFAPGNRI